MSPLRQTIFVTSLLTLASCAGKEMSPATPSQNDTAERISEGGELDDSDAPTPPASPGGLETLVRRNQAFAFDLHRALPNSNIVYSPHSVSRVMGPLFAGASGTTADELGQAMHFDSSEGQLHDKFARLDAELDRRSKTLNDKTAFRLKISNHIWAANDLRFSTRYLKILNNQYRSTPTQLDFIASPANAMKTINETISDATAGLIPKMLSPAQINDKTRIVVTNTVYFNAPWQHPFSKLATMTRDFRVSPDRTVPVPMMHVTASFRYAKEANFKIVELPYQGEQVSALIVLPDQGAFQDVDRSLSAERFEWLLGRLRTNSVAVALPKFTLKNQISLKTALKSFGVVNAFIADKADFSAMLEPGSKTAFISDIIHQTYINVDEAGTMAAAATADLMSDTGQASVTFTANRPFTFLIFDRPTREILFVARVTDPS